MEIITHTRAARDFAIAVPQAVINTGREYIMPYVEAQIDAQLAAEDAFEIALEIAPEDAMFDDSNVPDPFSED
jgi:hypothetical protein